jgi:hypothetical protein
MAYVHYILTILSECKNSSCNKAAILECTVRTLERHIFFNRECAKELRKATEENQELERELASLRILVAEIEQKRRLDNLQRPTGSEEGDTF